MSRKANLFFFLVVLFQERARISFEFISDIIAAFLSNCVGSLCPSSGFELEMLSSNVASKEFVRQIHFNTLWVTKGEMWVLEGFRLFKMCLHIKDNFFGESCVCLYIQPCLKTVSVSDISAGNLIVG